MSNILINVILSIVMSIEPMSYYTDKIIDEVSLAHYLYLVDISEMEIIDYWVTECQDAKYTYTEIGICFNASREYIEQHYKQRDCKLLKEFHLDFAGIVDKHQMDINKTELLRSWGTYHYEEPCSFWEIESSDIVENEEKCRVSTDYGRYILLEEQEETDMYKVIIISRITDNKENIVKAYKKLERGNIGT